MSEQKPPSARATATARKVDTAYRGPSRWWPKIDEIAHIIDEAMAEPAAPPLAELERELFIYWLIHAYRTLQRTGWEEGPSDEETRTDLLHVLANYGYDPNLSKAAKDLESRPSAYYLESARERWAQLEDAAPPQEPSAPQGERLGLCHLDARGQRISHPLSGHCVDWTPLPPAPQEAGK